MTELPHSNSNKFHQHLQNEYLRTYKKGKGKGKGEEPSDRQKRASPSRFAERKESEAVDAILASADFGKELTEKAVKKFIRQKTKDMQTEKEDHKHAQEKVEALLKTGKEKKANIRMSQRTWFTSIIGLAVVANTVQLGVQVDYPQYENTYYYLEHAFTTIFSLEMILKLTELHFGYFKDGWNVVDFVLVWLSIFDCWIFGLVGLFLSSGDQPDLRIFSILRILRIVRIVRAVRLFKVFHELWKIVKGILNSLRAVGWTALLLMFLLYICGIFCCVMVGKDTTAGYLRFEDELGNIDEIGRDFPVYEFYGTVPRAMYTLFETCIEPLNIRPVIERQPWMTIFFLAFIFLTTFGVLNVIIAVIVEHTMAVSEENKNAEMVKMFEEKMDMLETVRESCFEIDEDNKLSINEIQKAFENPAVVDTLEEVEMPLNLQPEEFFALLDKDGRGHVTYDEMLMQLTRATVQTDHQQLLDLKIGLHTTQKQIRDVAASVSVIQRQLQYGFCQMLPEEKMQSWPTEHCFAAKVAQHLRQKPTACASNADQVTGSGLSPSACRGHESSGNNLEMQMGVFSPSENGLSKSGGHEFFGKIPKVQMGEDERCQEISKTQNKTNTPCGPTYNININLPKIPQEDEDVSKVAVAVKTKDDRPTSSTGKRRFRPTSPAGKHPTTKGGKQVIEEKQMGFSRDFYRLPDDGGAGELPEGHPNLPASTTLILNRRLPQSTTSSSELPAQPPDVDQLPQFFCAPPEPPPPLPSDFTAPPLPPDTEVPVNIIGSGLQHPCYVDWHESSPSKPAKPALRNE